MDTGLLHFLQYSNDATVVSHVEHIGEGVRMMFDATAQLVCTVQRSEMTDPFQQTRPTPSITGANRKPDEWFGTEVDL